MSYKYNREQQKLLLLHEIVKEMKKWPLDINQKPGYMEFVLKQKEALKKNPGHYLTESIHNSEEQVTFSFSFLTSPPFPVSKVIQRDLIEELDEEGLVYYYNNYLLRSDGKEYKMLLDQKAIAKKKADLRLLPSVELVGCKGKLEKAYNDLLLKYPEFIISERELTELEKIMENSLTYPLWKKEKDGNYYYYQAYVHMSPQIKKLCDYLIKHYGNFYSLEHLSNIVSKSEVGPNVQIVNVRAYCSKLRNILKEKRFFKRSVIECKNGRYRLYVD